MKNTLLLLHIIFVTCYFKAQVGINTDKPRATLDVTAAAMELTKTDGFIAPRLTGNELRSKNTLYGTEQLGAIVYATNASAGAGVSGDKTINVTEAGYYYFDGSLWMHINGKEIEPWKIQATSNSAAANTDNIYQQGKVAIGFDSSNPVSEKQLEVSGDFRAMKTYNGITANIETNPSFFSETSIFNEVTDDSGSNGGIMTMFKNQVGITSFGTDRAASFDVISSGLAGLYAYDNLSGYQSSMGLGPNSSGMVIQKPSTGEVAILNLGPERFWYSYSDSSGSKKGEYFFPSNYGKRGQVLTTHGSPSAPGNSGQSNDLTWRDVADLVILKAPNGNCYKLTVDNLGILGTSADADCTVDAYIPSIFGKIAGAEQKEADVITTDKVSKMLQEQNNVIENLKSQIKKLQNHNKE